MNDPLTIALALLLMIESNNDINARGDYEPFHGYRAIGCIQTWKITVDEANRIVGYKLFTYNDRRNREKSLQMATIVLEHHGQQLQRKTGRLPTVEDYVRMWNGGPNGYAKAKTDEHWRKARKLWESGEHWSVLFMLSDVFRVTRSTYSIRVIKEAA